MLISKMQTYLSDKMSPEKVNIKIRKNGTYKIIKPFFNFIFLEGCFLTKTTLLFWNHNKIIDFCETLCDLFQGKKFSALRMADFNIYQHNNQKKIGKPQNKEKCLF